MIPAPYECLHRNRLFIARDVTRSERKSAYVCPDCGEFHVWINGADMAFALVSDAQVAAAGMYARRLAENDAT